MGLEQTIGGLPRDSRAIGGHLPCGRLLLVSPEQSSQVNRQTGLSHAQGPGHTHGGAALLGSARQVILAMVVVQVVMIEVMLEVVKVVVAG